MRTNARRTQKLRCLVAVCGLLLVHTLANAQERQPRSQQPEAPAQPPSQIGVTMPLVEPLEDYRIGPGDVIDIQVDRAPELSGSFRVSAIGNIMMQYLGSIPALEKTQEDLALFITERLRDRYLKNPRVTVNVRQMNSHSFFIQGAVNRPGVYQIEGRPSLMKLITVAGGLAANHGSTAYLIREIRPPTLIRTQLESVDRSKEPPAPSGQPPVTAIGAESGTASVAAHPGEDEARYELTKANISGLFKGRFDQNVFVAPGTIVNIPPTDVFFVAGEVHAPGSFPLKEGTTLRQAISLAQGTTIKAASSRAVIFRDDPTGKRSEIRVDVNQVMSGGKEDIPIAANDIIIIPNSRFKSVGSALLSAFGFSAARLPRF